MSYYQSGGLFSFIKKAVNFVNPVTNPIIRKVSDQLMPLAKSVGLGEVADKYQAMMGAYDSVMQPAPQAMPDAAGFQGGNSLAPQPGDMQVMSPPSVSAADAMDESEDDDDDDDDEG